MCYPDGSPEAAGYDDTVCPLDAGAIPQTYDCGHDDYFNPDPAPGSYLDDALERLPQRLHGRLRQLGMACGRDIVPAPSGQHGGADARRPAAARAQCSRPAPGPGSTPGELRAAVAARRRRRLGEHRRRDRRRLRGHRAPTSASPCAWSVTATNADGAAIAASPADRADRRRTPRRRVLTTTPTARAPQRVRIALRDRRTTPRARWRRRIVAVPAGREVRTDVGQGRGHAGHLAPAPVRRPQAGRAALRA